MKKCLSKCCKKRDNLSIELRQEIEHFDKLILNSTATATINKINTLPFDIREYIYNIDYERIEKLIERYLHENIYIRELQNGPGAVTHHDIFNYDYTKIRKTLKIKAFNNGGKIIDKINTKLIETYLQPIICIYEDIEYKENYKKYNQIKELNKLLKSLKKKFNITLKQEFINKFNELIRHRVGWKYLKIKTRRSNTFSSHSKYKTVSRKKIKGKTRYRIMPRLSYGKTNSRSSIKSTLSMQNKKKMIRSNKRKNYSPLPDDRIKELLNEFKKMKNEGKKLELPIKITSQKSLISSKKRKSI